ncbi:hypothetical protein [Peribacillus frigoritolerans]|uniref:hypothetical protein n=1 Tax=Peribacillus castrilensis TaxID=2897690 RepID=UPI003DA4496F
MKEIKINVKKSKQVMKEEKQEVNIDISKRKSGFKFSEALMESTDDSFDAFYNTDITDSNRNIKIYIFEDNYQEFEEFTEKDNGILNEENKNNTNSIRYSYLILDNGPGTPVDNIFDFGREKEKRFPDLKALNSLNGLFHYGMSSHLNVGTRLYFFSRKAKSEWWLNCLEGSDISNQVFTYKMKSYPEIKKEDKLLNLDDPNFYVRTVVFVEGVRKSEIEADNIDKLVDSLLKQFGITYSEYIEKGNKIYINDKEVEPFDPFLRNDFYTQNGIGSELIDTFDITLDEILAKEDSYVKQNITRKYRYLFESEKELLNQKITINMYHLNAGFLIPQIKSEIAAKFPDCMLPSLEDSGFYIKRNHRYIGRAAKILGVLYDHPSFNYFRVEIAFSPIFDDFFGIQVNKNRYDIKNSLASLIVDGINNAVKPSLPKYLDKYRKKNKPTNVPVPTISLFAALRSKAEAVTNSVLEIEDKITNGRLIGANINTIPTEQVILELKRQKAHIDEFIAEINDVRHLSEEESKKAESLISEAENVLRETSQILARIKSIIASRMEQLIEPAQELSRRLGVAASENRRLIKTTDISQNNSFYGYMLEPLNEVQTYGVLYKFVNLFPDEFDFILLDYSEAKGLDCLSKINKSTMYQALNLKQRFENMWEHEWDEFLGKNEGAFSFVELKYKLGEEENLGHSLVLVSHLICWDIEKGGYTDFKAIDGKYILTDDKSYLVHQDGIKKVKVICLRKKVEELLLEEFYNSNDDLSNYMSRIEKQLL